MLGSLIQRRENRQQSIWVVVTGPENIQDGSAVSSSNNRKSKKLQVRSWANMYADLALLKEILFSD